MSLFSFGPFTREHTSCLNVLVTGCFCLKYDLIKNNFLWHNSMPRLLEIAFPGFNFRNFPGRACPRTPLVIWSLQLWYGQISVWIRPCPWIFWKIFFIFAVNFHICQWEWFLWILFGLLRFIQRCKSYSRYPWPWKGMKN